MRSPARALAAAAHRQLHGDPHWHAACHLSTLVAVRRVVAFLIVAGVSGCGPDSPDSVGEFERAATVCASGPTLPGIDVSKYQGAIAWDPVAESGIAFAFIRVNHGLDDIDEQFPDNWAEARRVGITRGAYQYF